MLKISSIDMSYYIIHSRLQPHLPEDNELKYSYYSSLLARLIIDKASLKRINQGWHLRPSLSLPRIADYWDPGPGDIQHVGDGS